MRKQSDHGNSILLLMVAVKNKDMSKTQNVIHGFLLAFLTLGRLVKYPGKVVHRLLQG